MDLVNIIYRYVNRFINSDELIELLTNIDKTKFSKKEIIEVENLIKEVKKIIDSVEVEKDEIEIRRLKSINNLIEKLEKAKTNERNSKEANIFIEERINSLIKDKKQTRDSGPRYEKLYELLVNNSMYVKYCEKMTDLELLEFITQYICAPVVPNIDQEAFEDLVSAGIDKDKREALWRLAFNYNNKGKNFTAIVDYFIEKRDDYYLTELISAVKEDLNIDKLIEKVINTKDRNFIVSCVNRIKKLGIITDEEIEKLNEKILLKVTKREGIEFILNNH